MIVRRSRDEFEATDVEPFNQRNICVLVEKHEGQVWEGKKLLAGKHMKTPQLKSEVAESLHTYITVKRF